MGEQVEKKIIGKAPYIAFFIGIVMLILLLIYSYAENYAGGWGDLSHNVMLGLVLLAFALYCLLFFIYSLYLWAVYHKQPNLDVSPANWAMRLHGLAVISALLWFFAD